MLTLVRPLSAGNAVRLYTALADGAKYMRLLRKTADTFTGPTDPDALVVVNGFTGQSWVDHVGLTNGVVYYYRSYEWISSAWVDSGDTFFATPLPSWFDNSVDAQELVRERVALGIDIEVAKSALKPASGSIKVTTAPFMLAEGITLPTVSVHLESTGPQDRSIGDELEDFYDPVLSEYIGTEGWLARFSLTIAAVSLNPDERIALRIALRRIIQANLPVFADAGLAQIEFQQTDSEQFSENNAPLYLTSGAFSCVVPAFIRETADVITDVPVTMTTPQDTGDLNG